MLLTMILVTLVPMALFGGLCFLLGSAVPALVGGGACLLVILLSPIILRKAEHFELVVAFAMFIGLPVLVNAFVLLSVAGVYYILR